MGGGKKALGIRHWTLGRREVAFLRTSAQCLVPSASPPFPINGQAGTRTLNLSHVKRML